MNLSKKNKWLFSFLLLGCLSFYSAYKYAYQPHKTIENLKIDYSGNSNEFLEKIKDMPSDWTNKIVQLKGVITSKNSKGITLNNNVFCQFKDDKNILKLKTSQQISIKGRVIGYDDLLDEIKLDQCIIQE